MTNWNLPYKCLTCGNRMDVYPRIACRDVFCSACGINRFQQVVWVGDGPEPSQPKETKQVTHYGPIIGHIPPIEREAVNA
jgi:hypothetical protein